MTDYASFKHGAVTFPIPASGSGIGGIGSSLLRDADPALFYLLEYCANVIQRHVGPRLLAESGAVGFDAITTAVAETLPLNPEPFLTEQHLLFPLLTAYRKSSKFTNIGGLKHSVDEIELSYVLPPMSGGEAERLYPILKAVASVVDNRLVQGMDPLYQPTGAALGANVWEQSGVTFAEVKTVTYGGYEATDELFFPAVVMMIEVTERSDAAVTEFELLDRVQANIDIEDPVQETAVADVAVVYVYQPPTVTLATPNNGTKTGGTTVTLTGTNFRVGNTPTVTFGGVAATNAVVLSATSIQCVTPAHDAFTTAIVDVIVTNLDGQSGTLTAGYTFTSP
jgi:hypothetical protein